MAASPGDASASCDAAAARAHLWLDRHVARTGGRSIQQWMGWLRRRGELLHAEQLVLGGPSDATPSLNAFEALLRAAGEDVGTCWIASGANLRLAAQFGNRGDLEAWLKPIREMREGKQRCCTRITLSARVREPLSHYLSTYFWATGGHTNICHERLPARARFQVVGNATDRHVEGWRPSFLSWAQSYPNLQTSLMLTNADGRGLITDETTGMPASRDTFLKDINNTTAKWLRQVLTQDFDVVFPVDDMAAGMRSIGKSFGLSMPDSVPHASPLPYFPHGGGPTHAELQGMVASACPDMDACAAAVKAAAPFDYEIYEHAVKTFSHHRHEHRANKQGQGESQLQPAEQQQHGQQRSRMGAFIGDNGMNMSLCRQIASKPEVPLLPPLWRKAFDLIDAGSDAKLDADAGNKAACDKGWPAETALDAKSAATLAGQCEAPLPRALIEQAERLQPLLGGCDEIRLTTAFYTNVKPASRDCGYSKPPHCRPYRPVALPAIPSSRCNVAFVDSASGLLAGAENWTQMRRMDAWPFPTDGPRSAHVVKALAPLLFPNATSILYGDVKCTAQKQGGRFPANALRAPPHAGVVDLVAVQNPRFGCSSVEGELVLTWKKMAARGSRPSVFHDMNAMLQRYEQEDYDMRRVEVLPDTYCLGWRATPLAREFACRWAGEIIGNTMREQLNFHHAQPDGLHVHWTTPGRIERDQAHEAAS